MRCVIVGLGKQGRKRLAVARADVTATVDPVAPEATYRSIHQVPASLYDAALVCTPDDSKLDILRHLLAQGKHVLVEKPLVSPDAGSLRELAARARGSGAVCYTAYNHRFEPHLVRLKELIDAGRLGPIYHARFFYGNGTACDVRNSPWRDQGLGVLSDLGSHLLDLTLFLFGRPLAPFRASRLRSFETRALDHATFGCDGPPCLEFGVSLVSWRNTFEIDVTGAAGSAHVRGLCKWGASTFIVRDRVLPSGRPAEDCHSVEMPDPTWAAEYTHFKELCRAGAPADLTNDLWINMVLTDLGRRSEQKEAA
jgi:predicted dehydrogenase